MFLNSRAMFSNFSSTSAAVPVTSNVFLTFANSSSNCAAALAPNANDAVSAAPIPAKAAAD